MQRYTLVDHRTHSARVDNRDVGVVAFVFRIREHADQFARHASNSDMSVVEIDDFDHWIAQQQKNEVTHIVEVLYGLTRLISLKTLASEGAIYF